MKAVTKGAAPVLYIQDVTGSQNLGLGIYPGDVDCDTNYVNPVLGIFQRAFSNCDGRICSNSDTMLMYKCIYFLDGPFLGQDVVK
jgi:hypothetical protein